MLKLIHVTLAVISISGFTLRGVWRFTDNPKLKQRWVKIVPHINDTALLISAIILMIKTHQYPISQDWLSAKLIALVLYIFLGFMTLRLAKTKIQSFISFIFAILCFSYIIMVAINRSAFPFQA
jgi:uncharacterized membrane protein SirB2